MDKLVQKVSILHGNIAESKEKLGKCQGEIDRKNDRIGLLLSKIDELKDNNDVIEKDLDTADYELSTLKQERKGLTDEEEEKDRHYKKLKRSTGLSKEGSESLAEKKRKSLEKLESLQEEIAKKEKTIDTLESDLEMAEENDKELKEKLSELDSELVESNALHQSLSSYRVTMSGAGGSLRNQVTQRKNALEKRREDLKNIQEVVEGLNNERDELDVEMNSRTKDLAEIKEKNAQIIDDLEAL